VALSARAPVARGHAREPHRPRSRGDAHAARRLGAHGLYGLLVHALFQRRDRHGCRRAGAGGVGRRTGAVRRARVPSERFLTRPYSPSRETSIMNRSLSYYRAFVSAAALASLAMTAACGGGAK